MISRKLGGSWNHCTALDTHCGNYLLALPTVANPCPRIIWGLPSLMNENYMGKKAHSGRWGFNSNLCLPHFISIWVLHYHCPSLVGWPCHEALWWWWANRRRWLLGYPVTNKASGVLILPSFQSLLSLLPLFCPPLLPSPFLSHFISCTLLHFPIPWSKPPRSLSRIQEIVVVGKSREVGGGRRETSDLSKKEGKPVAQSTFCIYVARYFWNMEGASHLMIWTTLEVKFPSIVVWRTVESMLWWQWRWEAASRWYFVDL